MKLPVTMGGIPVTSNLKVKNVRTYYPNQPIWPIANLVKRKLFFATAPAGEVIYANR
jgi:hypothetical protein